MLSHVPRILISATASGVGKTTVTCGLLRVLRRRGLRVQACKCGPDYIDPQFHRSVLGTPSRNIDLFLAGEDLVLELVARGGENSDLTVMEGAMGYYDGITQSCDASAYDVARVTQTPALLVVDARGRALSLAAEVAGFVRFRAPSQVAGVILNRASNSYYPQLKAMIEREVGVPVLGYVPTLDAVTLPSRHLGLVSANEVDDLQQRVDALASVLEKSIDVDAILQIARAAEPLQIETATRGIKACRGGGTPVAYAEHRVPQGGEPCVVRHRGATPSTRYPVTEIAVAYDEAFWFYYDDTLELLQRLGAKIVRFSPLHDTSLPEGACGLYVGGGYPELHAETLSKNASMREQIRAAIKSGMPTIAECGGFLYLHETLEDEAGMPWPMVGAIDAQAYRQDHLSHFGYVTLHARKSGLLAEKGASLPAHEFHYWQSTMPGDAFRAQKPQSDRAWDCAVSTPTLYAGFPHLYLAGQPASAKRFVDACAVYGTKQVCSERCDGPAAREGYTPRSNSPCSYGTVHERTVGEQGLQSHQMPQQSGSLMTAREDPLASSRTKFSNGLSHGDSDAYFEAAKEEVR